MTDQQQHTPESFAKAFPRYVYTSQKGKSTVQWREAALHMAAQRDELAAALCLTLAELEAYELPKDPLHPQVVAVEAARAALAKVRA